MVDKTQQCKLLNQLFDIFDKDGDGYVNYKECVSGILFFCKDNEKEKFHTLFKLYDLNGDGYITKEEMSINLENIFKVMNLVKTNYIQRMGYILYYYIK